jgi:hypothetical protein
MSHPYSKLADTTNHNRMNFRKLTTPDGPLTRWRQAHPQGDQVAWQESMDPDFNLLNRLRGGPFMVDQFADPGAFEVYKRSFHAQVEGFRAVVFRTTMHYGINHPESTDFMVLSIDTPRAVPRTAVRPSAFGDRLHSGYQGTKIGDPGFDQRFHVQAEDEQFARAIVAPALMHFLQQSQLAETFAFVFDRGTLSTWNRENVIGPDESAYVLGYMSMMIDYLAHIFTSTPAQLWRT